MGSATIQGQLWGARAQDWAAYVEQVCLPLFGAALDAARVTEGTRLLDAGCGAGLLSVLASFRGAQVTAFDAAPALGPLMPPPPPGATPPHPIAQVRATCAAEIQAGRLSVRCVAIEDFDLEPGEEPFDLAFAARVGALDGRHPELEEQALRRIARALKPDGRLFIDGGDPLREVELPRRSV